MVSEQKAKADLIRSNLVTGLVGTKHQRLYHESDAFYKTINTLAELLPMWVDGIAATSREMDGRMAAQLRALEVGE